MFKDKALIENNLIPFGFKLQNDYYIYEIDICDSQFRMIVEINKNSDIRTEIIDKFTNEPYILHLIESSSGTFVGKVKNEYEKVLNEIEKHCYKSNIYKGSQTAEIIRYISDKYKDELEFLWKKFSSNAIWRRKDNKKWYGVLLILSKRKLGLDSDEVIEIIDLRAEPQTIENITDNKKYFKGYHMNKKHWLTIPLDGSVSIEEIIKFVDASYILAKKS